MEELQYEYNTDRFNPLIYRHCVGLRNKPHYHNQVELFYVVSGALSVTINGKAFVAKKGDIVYCNPYDIHQYYSKLSSVILFIGIPTEYMLFFNSYTGSGRLAENHLSKCHFSNEIYKTMKSFSSAKQHKFIYNFGMVNKLLGLLAEAMGIETNITVKSQNLIQRILYYINDNYKNTLTLKNIAEYCNYNPYYISRIFNSTFNCNLNSYINLRRLEALVEQKTKYPNRSITKIALEVGFPTERTFYRVFKDFYGCSPRQYFMNKEADISL